MSKKRKYEEKRREFKIRLVRRVIFLKVSKNYTLRSKRVINFQNIILASLFMLYLTMKIIKSKYRSSLTDDRFIGYR